MITSKLFAPDPATLQQHKKLLGSCIQKARKAQKISQEDFTEVLGCSVDTICSLEHGRFTNYDLVYA